jgi:hypothetical protein
MASEISRSLKHLEGSEELLSLEAAILRDRADALIDLRALEAGAELLALSEKLAVPPTPNILEIMKEFGRLDENDEYLHSRFLEFFLRPDENRHGLSDAFLKVLLRAGRFILGSVPAGDLDFEGDLKDTEVNREAKSQQGRVDLKVRSSRRKFVLLIEIKTLSAERDRQLARYWEDAARDDPGFAIAGLFLTPDGRQPGTAGKYKYSAISYGQLAELLEKCADSRKAHDGGAILVRQYAAAIRRWFVEDPDKKKLAWRIYRKYPAAAAYLSADGAKPFWQISEHLQGLVGKRKSSLEAVYTHLGTKKVDLWFVPRDWDKIARLRHAGTSEKEKLADDRLLIFWLYCDPESDHEYERQLGLYLGPVPGARAVDIKKLTGALTNAALSSSREIVVDDDPSAKWKIIWARTILTPEQLNQEDRDVVFKLIEEGWQWFLDTDFLKLKATMGALFE